LLFKLLDGKNPIISNKKISIEVEKASGYIGPYTAIRAGQWVRVVNPPYMSEEFVIALQALGAAIDRFLDPNDLGDYDEQTL
jgi:hypothetical protein